MIAWEGSTTYVTNHSAWLSRKSVIVDYFWRGVNRFGDRLICVPTLYPPLSTEALISGLNDVKNWIILCFEWFKMKFTTFSSPAFQYFLPHQNSRRNQWSPENKRWSCFWRIKFAHVKIKRVHLSGWISGNICLLCSWNFYQAVRVITASQWNYFNPHAKYLIEQHCKSYDAKGQW